MTEREKELAAALARMVSAYDELAKKCGGLRREHWSDYASACLLLGWNPPAQPTQPEQAKEET